MTYEEMHKELDAEFEPLVDKAMAMEGIGLFYAMALLHQWGEEKRLLTLNRNRVRFTGQISLPDCYDEADDFPPQEGA